MDTLAIIVKIAIPIPQIPALRYLTITSSFGLYAVCATNRVPNKYPDQADTVSAL